MARRPRAHGPDGRIETLAVIGVGLLGGSVAAAARDRGVAERIIGAGSSSESLAHAEALGLIDAAAGDSALAIAEADLVVLAAPVNACVAALETVERYLPLDALATDVASVKRPMVQRAEELGLKDRFVGAHPMCGGTATGAAAARADLFDGAVVAITAPAGGVSSAVKRVEAFWRALGAECVRLSAARHDEIVAHTSHLTQVAACALAAACETELARDSALVRSLVGPAIREATRVAESDPAVWLPIFQYNRDNTLRALDEMVRILEQMRRAIETEAWGYLAQLLEESGRVRRALVARDDER